MDTKVLWVSVLVGNTGLLGGHRATLYSVRVRCRAGGLACLALLQCKFVDGSSSRLPVKITQPTNLTVLPT